MDTWTLQMGFPVLNVNRDYDSNKATLTQERFLISKSKNNPDKHNYMWWVPITYVQPGGDFTNTKNSIWMSDVEKSKVLTDMPDRDKAVVFNVQETGYYRVNYDLENWRLLIKQLNEDHMKIHVVNRAQIIDDALNLARSGLLSYDVALGVTSYLEKEVEYIPWAAALSGMGYLSKMMKRTPAYGSYKKYMRNLVDPLYNRVGYKSQPGDQPLDVFLRKLAIGWACSLGNKDCIEKTKGDFKVWMDKLEPDSDSANPYVLNWYFGIFVSFMVECSSARLHTARQAYTGRPVNICPRQNPFWSIINIS
jgi:aminopeptidase N